MAIFAYDQKLKERSKELRNNATLGEVLLWNKLKGKQLLGLQFFRQKPIGYYIVDFYCPKLKLVIEIDGFGHDCKMAADEKRDEYLKSLGIKTFRFQEKQVRQEIDNVIQAIVDFVERPTSPYPPPAFAQLRPAQQEGGCQHPPTPLKGGMKKTGFTLLELVITVAIISILVAAASPVFRGFLKDAEMDAFSQTLTFDLKRARAGSMTGDGGLKWGLHLVSVTTTRSYYRVFSTPSTFANPSTTAEAIIYLPKLINFTNPAPSSSMDIIFDRIRGTISTSSIITFVNSVDNFSKNIVLNTAGNIFESNSLAQSGPCAGETSILYAGQTYRLVEIGAQCWFAENLNVGTMLADVSTPPTLGNDSIEKWCYNNTTTNNGSGGCDTGSSPGDGGLYTWGEANQLSLGCDTGSCTPAANNQGICPSGWHIPTDNEFKTLEMFLGMTPEEADATDYRGDQGSNLSMETLDGDNSSGFTGLLAGNRYIIGSFFSWGFRADFWSATEYSFDTAWTRSLFLSNASVLRTYTDKNYGYSVRCLKN